MAVFHLLVPTLAAHCLVPNGALPVGYRQSFTMKATFIIRKRCYLIPYSASQILKLLPAESESYLLVVIVEYRGSSDCPVSYTHPQPYQTPLSCNLTYRIVRILWDVLD